jgi:hypothetical protein
LIINVDQISYTTVFPGNMQALLQHFVFFVE